MSDTSGRSGRRDRREPAAAAAVAGSPVKGIVLIVFAVVIGFVLLQDEPGSQAQTATGSGEGGGLTIDDDDTTDSTIATTTTIRTPAQVKVIVANGSPVSGAAGRTTEDLKTLGYVTGDPANAPSAVQTTQILFQVGYEAEAKALATQLGVAETAVAAMPTPAPVADLDGAVILVILGPDIAKPA
jgi:hypothetical protein